MKRKCGIELAENFNIPRSEGAKQPQCPKEKEEAIIESISDDLKSQRGENYMMYNPQLDTFIWESVHPLIRIIPVEWDYTMPFGILHSKKPSIKVKQLINAINKVK